MSEVERQAPPSKTVDTIIIKKQLISLSKQPGLECVVHSVHLERMLSSPEAEKVSALLANGVAGSIIVGGSAEKRRGKANFNHSLTSLLEPSFFCLDQKDTRDDGILGRIKEQRRKCVENLKTGWTSPGGSAADEAKQIKQYWLSPRVSYCVYWVLFSFLYGGIHVFYLSHTQSPHM
jgi:hypothetical protein